MSPIINPDTSEAVDFGPIPEGVYKSKITKVEAGVSEKGNAKIIVYLDVEQNPTTTKERRSHLVTSGMGAMQFDQLLRATGFTEQADAYRDPSIPNPDFDTDWLVGQELMVGVEPNFYKDKDGVQKKGDAITTFLESVVVRERSHRRVLPLVLNIAIARKKVGYLANSSHAAIHKCMP